MRSYFMKQLPILALIFLLLSCTPHLINDSNIFFNGKFVKIEKKSIIVACNPLDHSQCIQQPAGSSGSAFLVSHKGDKSYFLTVRHICITDIGKYERLFDVAEVKKIEAVDLKSNRMEMEIEKVNKENDLCLLSTKRIQARPYPISKTEPALGDKVYNIATPMAVFSKDLVPLFSGYYSGEADNRKLFTIPATNGSSGSPVLNYRGEIIGVVSSVTVNFNNMAISPTLKNIRGFLNEI